MIVYGQKKNGIAVSSVVVVDAATVQKGDDALLIRAPLNITARVEVCVGAAL